MSPLPFDRTARVTASGGEVVHEALPIAVWPADARSVAQGVQYDHTGETLLAASASLQRSNLRVEVDDDVFTLVSAQPQRYFRHTTLRLRRITSS